jgi:type I restriction enzyme S subunit
LDREQLEKYRLRRDDIVFARTGSIEKAARIVNPPVAVFASYLIRGRPLIPELAAWLGLFVGSYSYVGQAKRMSAGVGRANVNAKNLARIRLPLPPRAEQARIVDTVDSYLSRLDAAVSSLDAAQLKLKAYRASILKAAVEGRLVPREAELARREGRSYESAEVLLKRILTERRRRWEDAELARLTAAGKTPNDDRWKKRYPEPDQSDIGSLQSLPEGWCWATVDQVGNVLLGRQRAPQFLTGKWSRPYLRVANIKDDRIDFGDVEEMDFGPEHFEKYCLQAGDILVSEGQSPHLVGQSATYRGELEGLCFQKTLHRFRPFSPGPTSEFAQTVFRAHVSLGVFKAVASITTNIAHLTLEKFKRSRFPLPPATEQERIVEEVARQMSVADAAERQIVADRRRLQRLRQSVLAWAFAGRLVDQSPTDEPAATLLAAIRAAREATPIATPTARRPRKPKAAS